SSAPATDFFYQLVIVHLSQNLRPVLAPCSRRCWFIQLARFIDPDYRFARERTKRRFEKASWAGSFWCVGGDFRAALWADSECADHCSESRRALPLLCCVKSYQRLRPDHSDWNGLISMIVTTCVLRFVRNDGKRSGEHDPPGGRSIAITAS